MSIRSGIRSSLRSSIRSGLNPGAWTSDATSGKAVPANASEWDSVMSSSGISTGSPIAAWQLQEAAGNFADSIGAFTLTASAFSYQKAIAGWTRKGAGSAADASAATASLTGGAIGDIQAASALFLAYVQLAAAPAATRDVLALGGSTSCRAAQVTITPAYKATPNDASATATGAANAGTAVRPVILHVNKAASVWRVITDQEIVQPTPWTAPPVSNALIAIGSVLTSTPSFSVLYAACFRGTAAELSNAQIKTMLQTLGWTVAW